MVGRKTFVRANNMLSMVFTTHDQTILLDWLVVGARHHAESDSRNSTEDEGVEGTNSGTECVNLGS